jgi:hypothetical protein
MGGWLGPRDALDAVKKRMFKPFKSVFTDCATVFRIEG